MYKIFRKVTRNKSNKNNVYDNFDMHIKEALNEYIEELGESEKQRIDDNKKAHIYEEISRQFHLKDTRIKTPMMRTVKAVSVIIVSSLLLSFFINFATIDTIASDRSFFAVITKMYNNTVRVFIRGEKELTGGNKQMDDYNFEIQQWDMLTLEKIQEDSPFTVLIPRYLPEGYEIDEIVHYIISEADAKVIIVFNNQESDRTIIFIQEMTSETIGKSINQKADGVEEMNLNNMKVFVQSREETSFYTFLWQHENINYTLYGQIEKGELIKIVESNNELLN